MNIGFDGKRAYHNNTGLGFFSRTLVQSLARYYPQHEYYLFNPKPGTLFQQDFANVHEVLPQRAFDRLFKSAWRSRGVTHDLLKLNIDLYHGLSHEIPAGLSKAGIAGVVAMHDMFPEIYPDQYKPIDVRIYRMKSRYACRHATRIMAISEETKRHITEIYKIPSEKIDVVYQSCDPLYFKQLDEAQKEQVREKYGLPQAFFLHVGTIIERKNLLNIVKAMHAIRNEINIPLVVVGKGGAYKEKVIDYLKEQQLEDRVIFLSDWLLQSGKNPFVETADLPAIYQLSTAMIYPSFYEGFGIPIIEAMAGGVPVITSNTSCMPEIGGDAAYYIDPASFSEMAVALQTIYGDHALAADMQRKGYENVKRFTPELFAAGTMNMYIKTLDKF